ncbi:hypothetical protein ACNQKP_06480 [Bdellovibrio bacteriovorus]|uniref:RCC1 domain-containing protein n=1 Tax=Bdellovibrio bacteriovorus TaxID=959 RepID=UPI003AA8803C
MFGLLLLSSCTTKNDLSLIFSSENTPSITLKVNDNISYTGQTSVPVKIISTSEISELSFVVGSLCSEMWEPYTSEKTALLPNVEGEHIISVKVRNKDGFYSDCTKAKIILDKSGPIVSDTQTLVSTRSLLTVSPRLNAPATTDNLSGIDKYEIKLVKTAGNAVIKDWTVKPKDQLYFDDLSLPDTEADSYYYMVRATDKVGNVSAEKTSPAFIAGPVVTLSTLGNFNQEQTMGNVELNLSRTSPVATTVLLKSIPGTALAGIDYYFPDIIATEVSIPAGAVTAKVFYSIMTKVTAAPTKSFDISITGTTNAASALPKIAVNIINTMPDTSTRVHATGYKALAGAAKGHSCALRLDGKLDCWGAYPVRTGQVTAKYFATEVPGASSIRDIATGYAEHNCYIDTAGDVYCFGENATRQLGNGTTTATATPQKLAGYTNVKKVTVGMGFTCMITSNDEVRCWGNNADATVGQATTTPVYSTPTLYGYITKAIDLAAGTKMACAIDEVTGIRSVKCWGKMGTGATATPVPITITGLPNDIQTISVNGSTLADVRHGCGLTESGDVWCWGSNYRSRRGASSGSVSWQSSNQVAMPVKAKKVKVATDSSCALGVDDNLYCWGVGLPSATNQYELTESYVPQRMDNFGETITDFQLGEIASCAITASTRIKCWGFNRFGEIGNGFWGDAYLAAAFSPGQSSDTYLQVVAGLASTCALRSNKTVTCWGQNEEGQLGTNNRNSFTRPQFNLPITNIKKITGRFQHYCALSEVGAVYCWGLNSAGQIGNNTTTGERVLTPYQIPTTYPNATAGLPGNIKDISSGYNHSCAVTSSGGVLCWGNNGGGESGHANINVSYAYPTAVPNLTSGVESIYTGISNTCAVKANATTKEIYCWGYNANGIIGAGVAIGNATHVPMLIDTITTTKEIKISMGNEGACYIHDGVTKCWGRRSAAASIPLTTVATGTITTTPLAAPQLAGATDISLGSFGGCATMTGQTVKCWGTDNSGAVSSTYQIVSIPTASYAFGFGLAKSISMGMNLVDTTPLHICAITTLGDLKCWGVSNYGEAHDTFMHRTPSYVLK